MSSPEAVRKQSYFKQKDAFELAAKLAEVGVYVRLEGSGQGWQVVLKGHTDLIDAAKVIDTFKVGDDQPLHALYRPFGTEDGLVIYAGSKP